MELIDTRDAHDGSQYFEFNNPYTKNDNVNGHLSRFESSAPRQEDISLPSLHYGGSCHHFHSDRSLPSSPHASCWYHYSPLPMQSSAYAPRSVAKLHPRRQEDPPSPPHFPRESPCYYVYPQYSKWQQHAFNTPTPRNRQPRDYSYYPQEFSTYGTPSKTSSSSFADRDTQSNVELFRRFIHMDSPPQTQSRPVVFPESWQVPVVRHPERGKTGNLDYIWDIYAYDVLCGRGVPTSDQYGNFLFKKLVKERQVEYLSCCRNQKPRLANDIIHILRSYGGRFVRRSKYPNHREICTWLELTEQRAYDKVCQALRDGATRIRQSMIAMSTNKKDSRIQDKENAVNEYH